MEILGKPHLAVIKPYSKNEIIEINKILEKETKVRDKASEVFISCIAPINKLKNPKIIKTDILLFLIR